MQLQRSVSFLKVTFNTNLIIICTLISSFLQLKMFQFQWGRAFWLGVGGVGAAGVALLFDLMHVLLVCVATRNQQKTPRLQRGVPARKSINEMYDQLPNVIRLDKHGMILDKARLK